MKHTLINRRKYCDSIIVCHAVRARWALRHLIRYTTPHTGNRPKSPRYTFCQWWTSVYLGRTRRRLEIFKCLFLYITMGLVDETYINKEKHFLYLHWKWNDRDDARSILTVLLLHFISDTRVEQVANEVYRASQGWRPGVLRLGCWSWLFQSPTWMIQFMGPFGAVHLKWSNVPWASSFFFNFS